MLHENLLARAAALEPDLTALRRAIHAEPELGLETPMTLAKAKAALADLPLDWREGESCTGAVAWLDTGRDGHSVVLRGDMDALPMPEQTGLPFASTIEGRMHACGHDAHTAMLAGAARLLAERADGLTGRVGFMFQPGEEGHHGARHMIEDGLLDPAPDAAFALHIMPNARFGEVAGRPGPLLAAADQFDIVVTGRGGHASMPHQTRDPVPVAAEIVTAMQALVTRRYSAHEACILTVSRIDAGSAHNVIADDATLRGTMRTLSAERREALHADLERLATNIAAAHECSAAVRITPGFPVTQCDERAVMLGKAVSGALFGEDAWRTLPDPIMGAEDFAYVLERSPGAMFFLGVAPEGESDWSACCGIHSGRMFVDERALPRGAALLAGCAERFLAQGWA